METKSKSLVCEHCGEYATFSRLYDEWWCADCRSHDIKEIETESDK